MPKEIKFQAQPEPEFLKKADLIGRPAQPATANKPARPAKAGLLPFSLATLIRMYRDGRFPAPVRLTKKSMLAWRASEVRQWAADPQGWKKS